MNNYLHNLSTARHFKNRKKKLPINIEYGLSHNQFTLTKFERIKERSLELIKDDFIRMSS